MQQRPVPQADGANNAVTNRTASIAVLLKPLTASLLTIVFAFFTLPKAQAQVIFTAGNLTQTQNFNGMTGNALPSGFTITSKSAGTGSVDLAAGSLASNATGSAYKFTSGTDYAIGFLNSGSYGPPNNITATLQNNTGAAITGFVISFSYEKYRSGARAWDWNFYGSTNGSAFTGYTAGDQSYAADAANTTQYFPPQVITKTVTISGLTIAQGSSYYLRWILSAGGSSNGQGLGIDDISITAVQAAGCTPPPAVITPAGPVSFCQNDSTVLNANTGAGLTYQWQLNGSNIGNATSASYTTHSTGNYTVIVASGASCSDTSVAVNTIANTLPTATVTPASATTFCAGGNVVLNAPTGAGLTYQWKRDGSNISNATSNTYTATTSGAYKVVVTNGSACTDSSAVTTVTVNALPTAIITPASATTFCAGGNVVLNAPTGAGLTYQWKLNGGNISNATSNTYTATTSGAYKVVVTNGSACTDSSAATTVTVNALPTATITPASATTFCAGGNVVLNAPVGTGLTYQWKRDGSNISNATSNTYTATTSGAYKVVVTNGSACTDSSAATTVTVNPLPAAIITPASTTTFCAGGSVILNAPTGAGLTYQWKRDGSNISNATSNTYTATTSGDYKVVVTNGSACTDSSAVTTVIVNALPTATITPASATTFCAGGSVALNAPTSAGLTYQWKLNGSNISNATSNTYTANTSGNYKVVVTNGSACTDSSAATTVTVNALPTATITPASATTFCAGGNVVLNVPVGTGLTYQWKRDGSSISNATSNTYTATTSGDYKVVVTNGSACTDSSAATTVTVNALPTATITPASATTLCAGGNVALNAPTGAGLTYQWKLNGSNISNATSNTYTANTSGSYRVIVTNTSGCKDSSVTTVTVNTLPVATITPAGPTTFCAGNSVVLNANTGAGLTYQWKLNGANIGGPATNLFTATLAGNYQVVVTNASGCKDSSANMAISVNPLPAASVTAMGITTFCAYDSVLLSAGTGTGVTYQWLFNGSNIAGATGNSFYAHAAGVYAVSVSNSNCQAVSTGITIATNQILTPIIIPGGNTLTTDAGYTSYQWHLGTQPVAGATSNTFTPLQSGYYTVTVTDAKGCTATSAIHIYTRTSVPNIGGNEDIRLYPNPATTIVYIDAPVAIHITITSAEGRLVLQQDVNKQIDVSGLSAGVYIVRICDLKGNLLATRRLLKTGE